jgi:hypothetical protein
MTIVTHGTLWATVNLMTGSLHAVTILPSLAIYGLRLGTTALISWRWLGTRLSFAQILLVLPKDLFMSAIWLASFLGDTVWWSGRRFRILRSGVMEPVAGDVEMAAREALVKSS